MKLGLDFFLFPEAPCVQPYKCYSTFVTMKKNLKYLSLKPLCVLLVHGLKPELRMRKVQ